MDRQIIGGLEVTRPGAAQAVDLAIRLSCSRPTRQGRPAGAVAARSAFAALDTAAAGTERVGTEEDGREERASMGGGGGRRGDRGGRERGGRGVAVVVV